MIVLFWDNYCLLSNSLRNTVDHEENDCLHSLIRFHGLKTQDGKHYALVIMYTVYRPTFLICAAHKPGHIHYLFRPDIMNLIIIVKVQLSIEESLAYFLYICTVIRHFIDVRNVSVISLRIRIVVSSKIS